MSKGVITKGNFPGWILTEQLMSDVNSSSSPTEGSSAKPRLIQVTLPRWAGDALELHSSVLTVEKSGGEWFLSIQGLSPSRSKPLRFPARDILINGRSLGHFLKAIETALF